MASTARQLADQLYAIIPHALEHDMLAEYGIEASSEQAQHIMRELLSMNLYWIHSALNAHLLARGAGRVFGELQRRIEEVWGTELGLAGHDLPSYWIEMQERRSAYDEIARNGGTPPSLYLEAAAFLESAQVIQADDRHKLLALFIDVVPNEAIGDLAAEMELDDG
ncbi:MAG: hypothetical protein ACREJU_13735 [Nitrospiraceae bacterium]